MAARTSPAAYAGGAVLVADVRDIFIFKEADGREHGLGALLVPRPQTPCLDLLAELLSSRSRSAISPLPPQIRSRISSMRLVLQRTARICA